MTLLDGITFLDDATRPEPPKLEGLTPSQRMAGAHLREIHDHLRENMRFLAGLIERASRGAVSVEDTEAEMARLDIVGNFRRFGTLCGQHCRFVEMHHSIEDQAVFPALARQSDVLRKIAERLRAEHVVVHELLVRLGDALTLLAREPTEAHFAAAREVYEAFARVLLSHLGYEEEAIGDALGFYEIF
jgi:hypothetical protein